MLSTTLAGGIWTSYRRHQEFGTTSPICPRCNTAVEIDFHRYWVCTDNENIDHPDVRATQTHAKRIARSAVTVGQAEGYPVLSTEREAHLCRGLPVTELFFPSPDDRSYHDHPYPRLETRASTDFPIDPDLLVYTDASGGPNNQWAHLRVVGQASVVIHPITHHCLWVRLWGARRAPNSASRRAPGSSVFPPAPPHPSRDPHVCDQCHVTYRLAVCI